MIGKSKDPKTAARRQQNAARQSDLIGRLVDERNALGFAAQGARHIVERTMDVLGLGEVVPGTTYTQLGDEIVRAIERLQAVADEVAQ